MKFINISSIVVIALIITACNTVKKTAATTPSPDPVPAVISEPAESVQGSTMDPAPTVTLGAIVTRPTGIRKPGEAELNAIRLKYQDVTMQTLIDGHELYTGVCTGCHQAQNIYSRDVEIWPGIIDEMALHAELTGVEKDATLKYVLAVKATQPEWVKY